MNLVHSLLETAREKGEKPAYIFEDKATSYAELGGAVTKFASGLSKLGVKQGDHVALLLGNSPYFVIGLYGAMRIGATVIPINPIYAPDEIQYILQNGDVKTVIALDVLLPVMQHLAPTLPGMEHIIVCPTSETAVVETEKMKSFTSVIATGDFSLPMPDLKDDDTAIILYTSGTTGKPKGAMLTHQNLYSNASDVASYLQYTEHDKVVAALPMFHVFCLTVALNASIVNGATVLIVPKFSPKEVFRVVSSHEATVFAGVPTMYNFLFQYPEGNPDDWKTLRLCISGGASLPVALLENFEKKFNVMISEGYGLSEASPVTCFNPLDRPRKAGSIGTNIINVENKIVNELGDEVKPGEIGELIVCGPNVMKGYYKMPEDTAATIRDGWLYTGDLARMDEEGYFYIVDRKKDLIIVGGYNVYPREVEEVLYKHPAVMEAVVLGIPDYNLGEAVKAYAVMNDASVSETELLTYCAQHLAKYKVPSSIEFSQELPKNTTGKILRRALKKEVGV
ncbi:fatty acid--CoA ligase family protein [Ectobacillus antri]|uniref:Fatty acid--CoA ligase family protein n=1 Tax=Ectobacillus antri TaxID=2486280 RepID=A0ABT6H3I8_9BACI|nr:fatty acid--CoA ligase family protein [Ectobacillus antri]MDG4656720.1 fatty acid--CoA ligase family protein [Ectobacillus antri]MDG5753917.1 fatty acid--CoA ligase family protein [Ectobacillus antri]